MNKNVLFIVNPSPEHVGAHFVSAAKNLKLNYSVLDIKEASYGNEWLKKFSWHFLGHTPINIINFNKKIFETLKVKEYHLLITTGISPILSSTLNQIKKNGIKTVNFLTDDPWNPANEAKFFWKSLLEYDFIFTPRKANFNDLKNYGCKEVHYLPFAYSPEIHYPELLRTEEEIKRFSCDISFIGGADKDRIPFIKEIIKHGLNLKLYGGYWGKYKEFKPYYHGLVIGSELRKSVSGSKISLCLVRQANRDGHAMRSYEFPAMGACMLVENTAEHRELFGDEGTNVFYFIKKEEMIDKIKLLLKNPHKIEEMRIEVSKKILAANTYVDRLSKILIIIK